MATTAGADFSPDSSFFSNFFAPRGETRKYMRAAMTASTTNTTSKMIMMTGSLITAMMKEEPMSSTLTPSTTDLSYAVAESVKTTVSCETDATSFSHTP